MAIITISRQFGSLGTDIANSLKKELEFEYMDKSTLEESLVHNYGIPEENFKKYDERKPHFWDIFSSDKDRYLHFMKTAIFTFARKGNCIILGRGAQVLLQNIPVALHVRIIAPEEVRIERIKEQYHYTDKLAEQLLHHSDHDRSGFHKFFFHVNWENADLYDLVINTRRFTVNDVIAYIKDSLKMFDSEQKHQETKRRFADLCLGQEVVTHLVYKERIPIQFLEAVAKNGVVTLKGSTITSGDVEYCDKAARQVEGVKDVINEVYFIPNTYGMT